MREVAKVAILFALALTRSKKEARSGTHFWMPQASAKGDGNAAELERQNNVCSKK